jgi:hypothetical protein
LTLILAVAAHRLRLKRRGFDPSGGAVRRTDDVAALHSATLLLKSFARLMVCSQHGMKLTVLLPCGAIVLAARDLSREAAREGLSGSIVDADDLAAPLHQTPARRLAG